LGFARGIAGITGSLLLDVESGLFFYSLGMFSLSGRLRGPLSGLVGGGCGGLLSEPDSGFPRLCGRLGRFPLGSTEIASDLDRISGFPPRGGCRAVRLSPSSGRSFLQSLFRDGGCAQAIGKIGVFDFVILI
jgi:hypothetical protein